jgi:hypothetical protein
MPRKVKTRALISPVEVTPEILAEWRWLREHENHDGDPPHQSFEWTSRWKKFYHSIGIFWGDMEGPFEATTERPIFDIARQPHRYETWLQGRAWRAALLAAEAER